jgi:hypothetical protein
MILPFFTIPADGSLLIRALHYFFCAAGAFVFFLCVIRIFKSYAAGIVFAVLFFIIFILRLTPDAFQYGFSALLLLLSFYFYTFCHAKGLKHNQDKHFLIISVFFYAAASLLNPFFILFPVLIAAYEKFMTGKLCVKKAFIKLLPYAFCCAAVTALYLLKIR